MNRYSLSALLAASSATPLFAQAAPAGGAGSIMSMLPMMLAMFAIIYFLMIRPEQKKQKEKQKMLESLGKGEKILTIGGLYGTITAVKKATISLRIADNTIVTIAKSAIADKIDKDPDVEEAAVEKKN